MFSDRCSLLFGVCWCVVVVETESIHGEYKTSTVIVGCCLLLALLFLRLLLLASMCDVG